MCYQFGLPITYRTESMKKRHKKLKDATEAAVATYNAVRTTPAQFRSMAMVSQIEADANLGFSVEQTSSSSTSSSSSPGINYPEGFRHSHSPISMGSGLLHNRFRPHKNN